MTLARPLMVVCLGLLSMLSGCSKEESKAELPRVGVIRVKPTDFAARVTLTGDVQARVQTDLSFRVGGKIISRSVDVGDHVKANRCWRAWTPRICRTTSIRPRPKYSPPRRVSPRPARPSCVSKSYCPRATPARASTTPPRRRCAATRVRSRLPRRSWPMPGAVELYRAGIRGRRGHHRASGRSRPGGAGDHADLQPRPRRRPRCGVQRV